MTKRFKFSIATNYINSEWSEVVELDFDDNATEEEIDDAVNEAYTQWLFEHNCGGVTEIE